MTFWTGLRTLAVLRRITKALEAQNDLTRERLTLEFPDYGRRTGKRKAPRLVDLGVASVEDWNEAYHKTHVSG